MGKMAFFLISSATSLRRAVLFASSFGTRVTRFIGRRGGLEVNSSLYPDLTMLCTQRSDVTTRQLSVNWLNRPPTGGYSPGGTVRAWAGDGPAAGGTSNPLLPLALTAFGIRAAFAAFPLGMARLWRGFNTSLFLLLRRWLRVFRLSRLALRLLTSA